MTRWKRSYMLFPLFGISILMAIIAIALEGKKSSPLPFEGGKTITLVTYNVSQGFDNSGKLNPHIIHQLLASTDATIIALQESDTMRISSGMVDLVYWLSKRLGMHYYYGPKTIEGFLGVSLLSKLPIEKATYHSLPSERLERAVIEVECRLGETSLLVVVPHLGYATKERYEQMKWIFDRYKNEFHRPFILMGDFNSEEWEDFISYPYDDGRLSQEKREGLFRHALLPPSAEGESLRTLAIDDGFHGIESFRSQLIDCWKNFHPAVTDSYTYWDPRGLLRDQASIAAPTQHIDYIFVSSRFIPLRSTIIKDQYALHGSDHLPLIATVLLKEE